MAAGFGGLGGFRVLLQHEQLEDVVAQENSLAPANVQVNVNEVMRVGYEDVRKEGWYRRVVYCDDLEGVPVLTLRIRVAILGW